MTPEPDIVAALEGVPVDDELAGRLRRPRMVDDRRDVRAAIRVELDTLGALITAMRLDYRDGVDLELDGVREIRRRVDTLLALVEAGRRADS